MVFKSKDILEYITSDGLWVMLYIHDENGEPDVDSSAPTYESRPNRRSLSGQSVAEPS